MNKNKILVRVYIPLIEKSYDIYIPINKKIGTIKKLVEDGLYELTDEAYAAKEDTNFYSKDTGQIYDVNKTVREADLQNGSKILLV